MRSAVHRAFVFAEGFCVRCEFLCGLWFEASCVLCGLGFEASCVLCGLAGVGESDEREQFRLDGKRIWLDGKRRWLERDRLYREQSHLLWRWDFVGLLASVCGLLFGLFLTFFIGLSAQRDLKLKLDYYGLPITYGPEVIVSMEQWELAFYEFGEMAQIGEGIAFLSLPGVLIFGALFCRRYFSEEARSRRILDREEWLDAERRRRQEGSQDD